MNKAIKEDWLEALRSGEYLQGYEYLDRQGGQCCLGVLCDILDIDWKIEGDGTRYYLGECAQWIPRQVEVKAKLTFKQQLELAELNDAGFTFEEIADYIDSKF